MLNALRPVTPSKPPLSNGSFAASLEKGEWGRGKPGVKGCFAAPPCSSNNRRESAQGLHRLSCVVAWVLTTDAVVEVN